MDQIATITDNEKPTDAAPAIDELREHLLGDLTLFDDFCKAIGKHPKTVTKMKPPTVRVGRTIYVPTDKGREWILAGCPPVLPGTTLRYRRRRAA